MIFHMPDSARKAVESLKPLWLDDAACAGAVVESV